MELLSPRTLSGSTSASLYYLSDWVLFRKVNPARFSQLQQGNMPDDPIGIVGASAAGLFTALLFARAGRTVRLFERAEGLEPAFRTLIVTDRIRKLLGPSSGKYAINEINGIELFTDGLTAEVHLDSPDLVIERSRLIRDLADEAQSHGAQLEFGRRFVSLEARNQSGIELTLAKIDSERRQTGYERVSCTAIVGADGAHSGVAQAAGWPKLATVPLVQALVELPSGMPSDTVRVWFIPDETPYFYWLIPESRERGALGLIGVDGRQTHRCLQRFMEKRHFKALGFQGARIPLYERWVPIERRVGKGSVYLVGDAAAQVKVTTLGGVVTGFRGALGLSEQILNGGVSQELRALRRELNLHMLIRRSIHGFRQADYSYLVDSMNNRMRRSLSRLNRDEAARLLWQVCWDQPRLLWFGLRGLLSRPPHVTHPPELLKESDLSADMSVCGPSVIQR